MCGLDLESLVLKEGVACLQQAVPWPLLGEEQLEQLPPELGGDRVVADERGEHLLRRPRQRVPASQPLRQRRIAYWI